VDKLGNYVKKLEYICSCVPFEEFKLLL